jgi:methylmalonyl-CoA mutase
LKIEKVKKNRNQVNVKEALDNLSKAAKEGNGNLLDLAIKASRARCTVGEISYALEKVYTRHTPNDGLASGAYSSEYTKKDNNTIENIKKRVINFEEKYGRRPRILIV